MSTQIERLRFFDGEYLRGFDFTAEQNYHLQMRRRLNMGLHLWGIVEGLEIQSSTQSGITQSWITPGMAIDGYGREIFVFAAQVLDLTDDALKANRVSPPGTYSVWLRYKRTAATPPSVGFSSCSQTGATTRWEESYDVMLLASTAVPDSAEQHQATEALSEDAKSDGVAVYLGTVDVTAAGDFSIPGAKQTTDAATGNTVEVDTSRVYIGVRAQRIAPPKDAGAAFDILSGKNTPQNPPTSVEVDGDMFANENVVVGVDFAVTPGPSTPAPSGNLKVAGDFYLNGGFYTHQGATWLALDQYIAGAIARFVPDVQTGTVPITIGPIPTPPTPPPASATGSQTFSVTSALQRVKSPKISAALADVQFDTTANVQKILNSNLNAGQVLVQVQAAIAPSSTPGAAANQFDVTLSWSVGPSMTDPGDFTKVLVPVVALQIAWVIVFYPDTSAPAALP